MIARWTATSALAATTIGVAILATAGLPALAAGSSADAGVVCNTVMDGDGDPALTTGQRYVKHDGSFACPQLQPVAAAPAPAPEPAPAAAPLPELITISSDVAFDLNQSELKPGFLPELDQIAAVLNQHPDTALEVVGHADSTGEADYNLTLSERRAAAVASYLEQQGVSRTRLAVSGRGEVEPVAPNETREGRALNRRVEIRTL